MISEAKGPWEASCGIDQVLDDLLPDDISGSDYEIVSALSKHCELPAGTIASLITFLKENHNLPEKCPFDKWDGGSITVFTPQDCLNRLNYDRLYSVLEALGNCGEKAKAAIPYLEYMIQKELEYADFAANALYGIQPTHPLAVPPPQDWISIDYGGFGN